jgi:hypothetical protein
MSVSTIAIFTAAEFARILRCDPRCVREILRHTPATGTKLPVRARADGSRGAAGKIADAWEIGALPSPFVQRVAKLAKTLGYRSPLDLMLRPPAALAVSRLSGIPVADVERAQKLQRALASSLAMPAMTSISERARIAAPHYKREFGKAVSDRYLRKLIDSILQADDGRRNFSDLRIYIPKNRAKSGRKRSSVSGRFDLRELDAQFVVIADRTKPGLKDVTYAWRKVVEFFRASVASGADSIALKVALRAHLLSTAPFLADSPEAMKRNLNRKLSSASAHGAEALLDRRVEPRDSGVSRKLIAQFADDLNLLARHARFFTGGRVSQAYRELHDGRTHNGERFSKEFCESFSFDCRKAKSRVPDDVRRAVSPMVAATGPLRLGSRAAKLALPSIQRDWSKVAAGDSYTSDDVTINHPVYDWDEKGEFEFEGRPFNVMRPQFLPVVDERSELPLGFSLIPQKNYTSWHIKTLIARICMRPEVGLPFRQFVFEKSIWNSRNVNSLAQWTEIDESFARNGIALKVHHATTPKAKIIEGTIGRLQNLDEYRIASYIGRAEQDVKFERVQKFLRSLKRLRQPLKADVHPGEMLMSLDECAEMLTSVMARYADEPQNGERLPGISPNEAWQQLSGERVHRVLPESLRFLLATAESKKTVTGEGIELRIGRLKHKYCGSEQLGALIGEKVRVRFNPELPEVISVSHIASDPHGVNPFSVPLFERLPAHGATSEDFARAREHQNAFAAAGRAIYRELSPKFNRTHSNALIGSPELRAAGEAHNRIEREQIDLDGRRVSNREAINQLAAEQRLAIDPQKLKRPERTRKLLESRQQRLERILAMERRSEGATI